MHITLIVQSPYLYDYQIYVSNVVCSMFTGETALSVAKTSNLKRLIKEAWVDQSNSSQLSLDLTSDSNHSVEQQNTASHDHPGSYDVVQNGSHDTNLSTSNIASSPNKKSCFITQVRWYKYCSCDNM